MSRVIIPRRWVTILTVALAAMLWSPTGHAQDEPTVTLRSAVVADVATLLNADTAPTPQRIATTYWHAMREHGTITPLVDHLQQRRESARTLGDVRRVLEVLAHVHWRRGDIDLATELVEELLEADADDQALRLWYARLLDSQGRIKEAREAYEAALTDDMPAAQQRDIRLRLALMGLVGGAKEHEAALAEFVQAENDDAMRNRAAIVLAVQGRPKDALSLFVATGEGTKRFQAESRRAEWAIRSDEAALAKEAAWIAVRAAQLRRDRRYALTLLVEAFRMDDTLGDLVTQFGTVDDLSAEERNVWIALLREQELYDEAIALFRDATSDFTTEMRRELLEMEREAGREDEMIAEYRRLIDTEPGHLTWRTGLTQVLLERGDQADAEALWPEFIAQQTSPTLLLDCASALSGLGLDELAERAAARMLDLGDTSGLGLLFTAGTHQQRGRLTEAEAVLDQLNALVAPDAPVRFDLAEAYEQLGRQAKAVEVMEGIREARDQVAEDLEMRLAWLYSEIGQEEKGLDLWRGLWLRINSVPRRRYVEDRMMAVASRLGTLADLAIDFEEKLTDGTASEREAGLLIRIYTRVNDPISATEILDEHMRQTGGSELDALVEKARIYLICNDYHNYERTIHTMMRVDPEGKGEYLRQLAMSQLERGRPDEARAVLVQLRDLDVDEVSREFEAGVLSLAGMREEAAEAYRKGIAEHPDRIESYLLLANLMRDVGETSRALGMFQYLAETAEKDDLFTIAIDGLLNLEADTDTVQWARRITLERLAGRDDKNYLYQLLADLSEEAGDKDGQIRALENSLAVSGTRRLSVLRECMDLSSNLRGGAFAARGSQGSNAGNTQFFAFARRLVGLEEAVPPQVFLDLGSAFLDDKSVDEARQAFSLARNLPDERSYRRDVASIFESSGHRAEALRVYERLLRTSPSDVALIAKVAQLHEQEGRDDVASRFYIQGIELLLRQAPLTTQEQDGDTLETTRFVWSSNRDAYQTYYDRLVRGLLVTLPDEALIAELIDTLSESLRTDLDTLASEVDDGAEVKTLAAAPRIQKRARALRRLLLAFDRLDEADRLDLDLLARFPDDDELLRTLARTRIDWGYYDSARRLAAESGHNEDARRAVRVLLGDEFDDLATSLVEPASVMRQLVPMLVQGDREAARALLRRTQVNKLANAGMSRGLIIVNGVAQVQGDEGTGSPTQFMQTASRLGDDDLVLHFARGSIKAAIDGEQMGAFVLSMFDAAVKVLPEDYVDDYCQYIVELLSEKTRLQAKYMLLADRIGKELGEAPFDDEALLTAIDENNVSLGWELPAEQFLMALPESIRSAAFERAIAKTAEGQRANALFSIPFSVRIALDEDVSRIVRDAFLADLQPAREKGYVEYLINSAPTGTDPVRVTENSDLALEMIAALRDVMPGNARQAATARRAMILRQRGEVEEALALTLELFTGAEPPSDAWLAVNARNELFRVMMPDHTDEFLAALASKEADQGPSIELTDQRLRIVRSLRDAARTRDELVRAVDAHPDEQKYLDSLAREDERAQRLRAAITTNERILEKLRAGGDEAETVTKEMLVELIVEQMVERVGGAVPAAVLEAQYDDLAAGMTFEELKEFATRMGVTIPVGGKPTLEVERRLASLWRRLDHPLEAVALLRSVHAQDKQAHEEAEAAKGDSPAAATGAAGGGGSGALIGATVIRAATIQPASTTGSFTLATPIGSAASGASGADEEEEGDSIQTVRKAVDAEDTAKAKQVLRRLWRQFPRDDDSPFMYYGGSSSGLTSLNWPEDEEDETDEAAQAEKTAQERRTQRDEARERRRGGLALFKEREEADAEPPTSAWKVLAEHEFGVDEMQRALRSRTAAERRQIKPVILGLLAADRAARGDEVVRDELLASVRSGQAGQTSLIQLFALLNESPDMVSADDVALLDDLVRTLEPDETRLLSRVAWLYAAIGESDRAVRLYEFCAASAQTSSRFYYWDPFGGQKTVNLKTLVTEIREQFEGDELITALERVFGAASADNPQVAELAIEQWTELLSPEEALARTRRYFEDVTDYSRGIRRDVAHRGAKMLARAGELDEARRCLNATLRTIRVSDLPEDLRWNYWGRSEIEGALNDTMIRELFPADGEGFADSGPWLLGARDEIRTLMAEERLTFKNAARALIIVGLRLHEQGATSDAAELLTSLHDQLDELSRSNQLLLLDALRETGDLTRAHALAASLHAAGHLPAPRFADLVRDTAETHSVADARSLARSLMELSLDDELLETARELAIRDEEAAAAEELTTLIAGANEARDEIDRLQDEINDWKKPARAPRRR